MKNGRDLGADTPDDKGDRDDRFGIDLGPAGDRAKPLDLDAIPSGTRVRPPARTLTERLAAAAADRDGTCTAPGETGRSKE